MSFRRRSASAILAGAAVLTLAAVTPARATLPPWLQHVVGASTLEAALYRAMQLPGFQALYPRPPREAQAEVAKLIVSAPANAELYQLRARADEQALDEASAESDWKLYASHATDPVAAKLELADFYERRMLYPQEIATLKEVAAAPPIPSEMYLDPMRQRSWIAFERILGILDQQGISPAQTAAAFDAFLLRYPDQPAVYSALLQFQLEQHDWAAAEALLPRYSRQFPHDDAFPIRAQALLQFRRGNVDAALAVYDRAFQPLWSAELVQSYMALLDRTHRQRAFVAAARQQFAAHPDGPEALNALARIFYYDQQAGRSASALQTLDAFRIAREARNAAWSPEDLHTLAQLSSLAGSPAETARYNYALASVEGTLPGGEPAAQSGLAGLVHILLSAPSQPLPLGAGNLTLYRDIATLDQGPGYWNGILSLWLNGTDPAAEYASETAKAQTYFERSKAAELLAELDKRFPAAPQRASLHAELVQALAQYGQPAAVISAGRQFLDAFPSAPERSQIFNAMADAYARQNDTASEFALYESQLSELAARTGGLPLTASANAPPPDPNTVTAEVVVQEPDSVDADAGAASHLQSQVLVPLPTRRSLPEATDYAQVLDRYLGRLTATNQLPRALTVLRRQLDNNPSDPLLYERLSTFLQQNNLSAPQEQVFQLAIAKFQQPGYYDKLARFYLRLQRRDAFAKLTRQVTDIFSGTDLDSFFANVTADKPIGPQLAVRLNLYAAARFPHDLAFTRNLLAAYQAPPTRDPAAYEALLRRQWWVSADLRDQFLAWLGQTGKLQDELSQLHAASAAAVSAPLANPAAAREAAEIDIFTSHFEEAAPLLDSVAALYPADPDTGDTAISLFRSLAYLDSTPASTASAVAIEKNLLAAAPDDPNRLATLGDLYAEATANGGEDLASAAPFWQRIPELHPGSTQGFLTSAAIFWDYFQFDDATAEIARARTRFHSGNLFGYEAGAIAENRNDLQRAVAEYVSAATHPIDVSRHFDSGAGVLKALLNPPSDAADSNLRSTAQNFFGSEEARGRLLQLATRPSARVAIDEATAKAVTADPANTAALSLRADVLAAQYHPPQLTPLLEALFNRALDRAATLDQAAAIGELAQARSLTSAYERSLIKQAALTSDPVQKIELQYTLARSMEARSDVPGATRVIAEVYAANPRILGVVRATTDFYDRTGRPQLAIRTLLEAAQAGTPALARDFTLEAAGLANQANDTAQARNLALGLLAQTPFDARVLALLADSYARAHDDAGLETFYLAQLDAAAKAPNLASADRRQAIATLRRGLIPALTRLHDFKGATAQYIALLSAYPEDANTGQEAALYALKHGLQPQLLDFLQTTVKQSPRDSRFMVLLAQVETTFEDLPAAQAAYSQAIALRKDRVDLYTARVAIETQLSQTDPHESELAAADFERLYQLSYHDPAWMVRLAELRARQGRAEDAVNALQTAYIAGHAETASDFFTVAGQLADWSLLPQARTFAERGVALAGPSLLTPPPAPTYPEPPSGAAVYARILTRLGMADQALTTLTAAQRAANAAATSPSALAAALAREDIADEDADAFRASYAERQRKAARETLQAAVHALGDAVKTWYTPEQKQSLALSLDKMHGVNSGVASGVDPRLALQVATAAGLSDREAEWRKQVLVSGPLKGADLASYVSLQRSRLQFADLAHTLESYAARLQPKSRRAPLVQSAQAYRDSGDTLNETRVTRSLVSTDDGALRDRYFSLLLLHDRPTLLALAGNANEGLADASVNFTVANGTLEQALASVARRGQALAPVWRPASASLVETYFAAPSPTTGIADFTHSLASETTIADRLAAPPNPTQQLTGTDYFLYSSRFGIFLSTVASSPDAEDFLAAELEAEPGSPTAYLELARTYVEAKNIPAARAEYGHALELSPADPAILDELATVLYQAGRKPEANAQWSAALAALRAMQQQASYPESWFTSLETIARHLGERHLTEEFRADLETILGPYFAKNGSYRSNELLEAVYRASATPAQGTDLLLSLTHAAPDADAVLQDLDAASWLDATSREAILRRRIALARTTAASTGSLASQVALQLKLVHLYLDQDRVAQAQAAFDDLPAREKKTSGGTESLVLAARARHLQPLLDAWQADPDSTPDTKTVASAIHNLQAATSAYKPDPALIRPLQEFLFAQKDQDHTLLPTDFLSLAQARIDTGDAPGALQLMQRLALAPSSANSPVSSASEDETSSLFSTTAEAPSPYANLDLAAALLERNHLPAQALPFLRSLVRLTPWAAAYRLRLARALDASSAHEQARSTFLSLARDANVPYDLRVQAARALGTSPESPAADLGSAELLRIAHPTTAEAARQPYFAAARVAAATLASVPANERESLLREAIAIEPTGPDAARARLDLLRLQQSTANPSIALAIYRSLQNASPPPAGDDTQASGPADDTAPDANTPAPGAANRSPDAPAIAAVALPPAALKLDAATRVQLALQLSSAFERDGDLNAAASFAQLAAALAAASDAPRRATTVQRLDTLRTALLLAGRNLARRPILSRSLTQSVQVRPHLSAMQIKLQETP